MEDVIQHRLEERNCPDRLEDGLWSVTLGRELKMGGSFESIRIGVKEVSARWLKARKALKKEDQIYGQKLAEMAKRHSSEAFYALDDPLDSVGWLGAGMRPRTKFFYLGLNIHLEYSLLWIKRV